MMKYIDTRLAVGHVLCHDITQIIPGEFKGARFRKGHIVAAEDIPVLLSMGKERLYIYEASEDMLHENDAAERLAALCKGGNMRAGEPSEGKIELFAECDGLFLVDAERLLQINMLERLIIVTRHTGVAVRKGDKLCGTRVIPLLIDKTTIEQAELLAGDKPLLSLKPFKSMKAGIVTTGSEIAKGLIEDRFTHVVVRKLSEYGIEAAAHRITDDKPESIASAIAEVRQCGAELVICTGGMSVDPDDRTPAAIRQSGAEIISYGAPVLPGAMLMVSYYEDGSPVLGLPGCVMYAKQTVFDLLLPYIAAGERITRRMLALMGCGGLCLGCEGCTYPNCGFGKRSM